ncbi:toll/interleukin-1 receptor domain-containing protein [Microbacterium sp. STN6]|uniref:toll/interleukin-1 receptor domain-containing protein n=1 Tax=Microbacterium sp. STN6 TaxID=2995588 RepID=UPI002260D3C5|nr:toll/interleukin-1 receptor domain-containing protein [Microbacterium sp. STN6]MCX7521882.1 toll/interleukin-1 receptor domain-containing protein [Microbacterium sp. STN6]
MTAIDGFWSYVHADDDAESGRMAQLARDVVAQFEMLTGESISLFLDRDRLQWGDDWRPKVDASLSSIAFFVPVITPRYFMSEECRRELNYFARQAQRLGIEELVLPVLWIDVPGLHEDEPTDELLALVKRFQWSDWTTLRFSDLGSGEYRKAVAELAARLVQANSAAEAAAKTLDIDKVEAEPDDDDLGALDKLGVMEESLPQMTAILNQVGGVIEEIGLAMQGATGEIEANTNPSAALGTRLRIARKLAGELATPATSIRSLGNDFSSSLNDVDEGVRIIIARAPEEVRDNPQSRTEFEGFFDAIRGMVAQSEVGLGAVANMIAQLEPIEKMSRDLRQPLRTLREGLTLFVDGLTVMRGWVSLIDAAEPLPSADAAS